MQVNRINAPNLSFSSAYFSQDKNTNQAIQILSGSYNEKAKKALDDTMDYLDKLSEANKTNILVKLELDPYSATGAIQGVVMDKSEKKPPVTHGLLLDPMFTDLSTEEAIIEFKNQF